MSTVPETPVVARYQDPDSEQTLAEGLEEYYASMGNLDPLEGMDPEARALFDRHDAAHVVFGCDTTIEQEVLMDTWTIFGSDVGVVAYAKYLKNPTARAIALELGVWRTIVVTVRALPAVVRVFLATRRMKKRWPWDGFAAYRERPLREIRAELGVDVRASVA